MISGAPVPAALVVATKEFDGAVRATPGSASTVAGNRTVSMPLSSLGTIGASRATEDGLTPVPGGGVPGVDG